MDYIIKLWPAINYGVGFTIGAALTRSDPGSAWQLVALTWLVLVASHVSVVIGKRHFPE